MAGSWNTGADKTSVYFFMNNKEESIFQKQTDNTCIRLLKISKIGILKCDELVLQDMQEIVIKMYDILCIEFI